MREVSLASVFQGLRQKITSRQVRIAVLGDILQDVWVRGQIVKQEQGGIAPVFRQEGEVLRLPGGAGNVARQLERTNVEVFLVGLGDHGTPSRGTKRTIPVKHRYCTPDGHILFRHDEEPIDYGLPEPDMAGIRQQCLGWLRHLIREEKVEALILSDYGKGTLDDDTIQRALQMCHEEKILSVVDPWTGREPAVYESCSVFKPNAAYCERWLPRHRPQVMTDGSEPPLWGNHGEPQRGCDRRTPVVCINPVGAGDAFTAWLTVALRHMASLPDAAEWAYSAGRVYVQRPFAEPVWPHEIQGDVDPVGAKVMEEKVLVGVLRSRQDKRVILANGCFDMLHAGHLDTLAWARQQGDILVVAVNSDGSVRRLKGSSRPIIPLAERMHCLASLACVDYVVSFDEETPHYLLETLQPDAIVKGHDCAGKRVVSAGLPVLIAPAGRFPDRHTTTLTRHF